MYGAEESGDSALLDERTKRFLNSPSTSNATIWHSDHESHMMADHPPRGSEDTWDNTIQSSREKSVLLVLFFRGTFKTSHFRLNLMI